MEVFEGDQGLGIRKLTEGDFPTSHSPLATRLIKLLLNTLFPSRIDKGKSIFEFMRTINKWALAFLLLIAFDFAASAQAQKISIDKIAGVVGDRIILESDIQNSLLDIQRQGGQVPDNGFCMLMEQAVVSKILMLQAEKDSLPVTDDEVEAELEQKVRYYINQLGSQQALEEASVGIDLAAEGKDVFGNRLVP